MNNKTPSFQDSNQDFPSLNALDYKGWRERFIVTILRIICVLGIALIAISFPTATATDRILFFSLYFALLMVTILKVKYSIRAFALIFMVYIISVNAILAWGPWIDGSLFFVAFVTLSALLLDQRIDIIALLVSIFTLVVVAVLQQLGIHQLNVNAPVTTAVDWITYTINFSIISIILLFAINQFKGEFIHVMQEMQSALKMITIERTQLENRVHERTDELETRAILLRSSAAISKTIAEIQDISDLMETTTRLTSDQFGYYHVGLYLLDERKRTAFLQTSSSISGKQLIGQGFRIEPDRLNPFNLIVQFKRPYITSDVDDVNFIRDVNFPLTRSRMLLPLTVRNNVIGVLDMHSDQSQSFTTQDAEVLQTLADLVAISIDNARLINETKNLVHQLETNTSIQTREIWTKFTSRHKPAYQYTPAGVRPLFANNKQDNPDGLRVPLILHGQNIGNIVLKRKGSTHTWSERERVLVEKVANQVALALENSRLVDETQKNAVRDQVIANISARVRETLDVESVLRTATTELRRAFDLKEAEIIIGTSQTESASMKKPTGALRPK
jgi:GAF domain-containing protein